MGTGGLEPPWISPHDPKSCASASSATSPVADELYVNSIAVAIPNSGIRMAKNDDEFRKGRPETPGLIRDGKHDSQIQGEAARNEIEGIDGGQTSKNA